MKKTSKMGLRDKRRQEKRFRTPGISWKERKRIQRASMADEEKKSVWQKKKKKGAGLKNILPLRNSPLFHAQQT